MGLLAWIRGLFGGSDSEAAPPPLLLTPSEAARDAFWRGIGQLDPDPILQDGLRYRVVRRGAAVLLATDGMSDPAPGADDRNGCECELFVQCAEPVEPLAGSWMMALLGYVATNVKEAGGINAVLDRYGVLSMELPHASHYPAITAQIPEHFLTGDDALGVLIGGPAPDFVAEIATPLSPSRTIPLVLLTAPELGEIRAGDDSTREAVAAALAKMDYTSLHRESLA